MKTPMTFRKEGGGGGGQQTPPSILLFCRFCTFDYFPRARSFGNFLAGNPTRPLSPVAPGRHGSSQVTSDMGIPFPDLGAFFSKLKFRVFCYS